MKNENKSKAGWEVSHVLFIPMFKFNETRFFYKSKDSILNLELQYSTNKRCIVYKVKVSRSTAYFHVCWCSFVTYADIIVKNESRKKAWNVWLTAS